MINADWRPHLQAEFCQPYFQQLADFLHTAYQKEIIYPPKNQVFNAFSWPLKELKVVILGQDPYHGKGQANGLAFSVKANMPLPPSLRNIFQEIKTDCGACQCDNGDLSRWSKQGVLLLNNTLTVKAHQPGSHRQRGWETFTTNIIKLCNRLPQPLVFMLWGRDAQTKATLLNKKHHLVLMAAHPSPFSAHHGFFGCRHFSQANQFLKAHGRQEIIW